MKKHVREHTGLCIGTKYVTLDMSLHTYYSKTELEAYNTEICAHSKNCHNPNTTSLSTVVGFDTKMTIPTTSVEPIPIHFTILVSVSCIGFSIIISKNLLTSVLVRRKSPYICMGISVGISNTSKN